MSGDGQQRSCDRSFSRDDRFAHVALRRCARARARRAVRRASPASMTTPMTATIRMNAVTSNGSNWTVNSAVPKSRDAAEDVRRADRAGVTPPCAGAMVTGARDDTVDEEAEDDRDERRSPARRDRGKRFGPTLNGATPLESSAMTNTNKHQDRAAVHDDLNDAENSAESVKYMIASSGKVREQARRRCRPACAR